MPGLKQLEKFSNDIKEVGDEEKIRAARGEKVSVVPLPQGVPEDDDSDDFLLGLPKTSENESKVEESPKDESAEESVDLGLDSLENSGINIDDIDGFGDDDLNLADSSSSEPSMDFSDSPIDLGSDGSEDFGDSLNLSNAPSEDSSIDPFGMDSFENIEPKNDATSFDMDEFAAETPPESSDDSFNMDDFSAPADNSNENSEIPENFGESIDAGEAFDSSDVNLDGVDFDADSPKKSGGSASIDDEFPETHVGGDEDDFLLSDDFAIEGYTDTDSAGFKNTVDTVDFASAKDSAPRSSLTEEEYSQFRKNLLSYPLNLRVVVEDTISKDGDTAFKDDTVFEIIDMVLKKTSVQKLAAYMEKLLDVQIQIPRDFEHRTYEQYEAYKQSFEYQLKNRIIPAAIIGLILLIVGFGLFKAGKHFVYKPLMANSYYKEGYALLENNEYPESEEKFKKGVEYRPNKKWFFKYARGYREHHQFERAAKMYRNILGYFNYDKEGGLEYARMELYDRADYAEAERILRRYVLDNHINDPDGELLLGDVFLEWADEDKEKYEDALKFYSDLETRFPKSKLYSSRMLRYYIRTDQLREVLVYKSKFYPGRKSLGAEDWTELSGYLLDKLYGTISRNDEYLRSSIEDVLKMLEYAVQSDVSNPVARYNLARYYIHNGYKERAQSEMSKALDLFNKQKLRTKKNIYKEINASRILGELYVESREYDEAQKVFTQGINRYNEEQLRTGLIGDENTGKLFADMGDIDYFITGDIDSALTNYETALETKSDTPSINYRVGAIRYSKKDYAKAFASFVKVSEAKSNDCNLLIALGNVLALRGDNFAAQSYYTDLLRRLDSERALLGTLKPQEDLDDNWLVDMYLKVNNNLGVTLFRLAKQTGNSNYSAQAMTRFSESIRAWDALTRDQQSMIRLSGGNLAGQNAKFVMSPTSGYEPAIYTDIPRTLFDEKVLN